VIESEDEEALKSVENEIKSIKQIIKIYS